MRKLVLSSLAFLGLAGSAIPAPELARVQGFDPLSGTFKLLKAIDLGGGEFGLAVAATGGLAADVTIVGSTLAMGSGLFVRLTDGVTTASITSEGRQKATLRVPDVFTTLLPVDCSTVATVLFSGLPTEAATEEYIISGFNTTTATVFIGDSGVTTTNGTPIVTGSPPVVIRNRGPLYCIVAGLPVQIVRRARSAHSVAP